MPTTKTTKKENTAPKKVQSRAKAPVKSTAVKTSASPTTPVKNKMTVADLRKKVMDPKNRKSLLLAIGIILLAVIIYFAKGLFVAATVNGQPISRLAIIRDLENQSGKMAIESAITRALVFQEAQKKNITATQKEINDEIEKIKKQFTTQGQNFDDLLAAQGLTREKFENEVKIQIMVTKILGDKAKVTDKEFNDFLEKNKDLFAEEKDVETAKKGYRQQMEQQKLSQKYQEWMAELKKKAKINYFVGY